MTTLSTNEFRAGLKVMLDHDPCNILENEFVKPGKGQAFNRVKLRNLKTGRVIERTFKSGDTLEVAEVSEIDMQFLYEDGEFFHFMQPETFEQLSVDIKTLGETKQWLKAQEIFTIVLWNHIPLSVMPPNFIVMKIVETDPGLRGDTSGSGGKPATLESGAVIRVPLFVQIGEWIKVDTRTQQYVARIKE